MEPETAAVLRKDVAGWVAEGAVNCRRCVRVRSVHWRGYEIHASGTGCLQNANQACAEKKHQGVLFKGPVFLSVFWIPICYLFCRLYLSCLSSFCLCFRSCLRYIFIEYDFACTCQ